MNNYGKRLTRAEIFSALFAGEESAENDVTPTLDRIAQNINDELGFGLIDNDTVLQAVLARRAPDVQRRSQRIRTGHANPSAGIDAHVPSSIFRMRAKIAHMLGEAAIRRAVLFLQAVVGVPHFTLLAV